MYELIAYCGLDCERCPAYIATQNDDMEELARVASWWGEHYGITIPPETILCDGCKSDTGRICLYCTVCQVKDCAIEREVPTCAHCDEYICEKLESLPAFIEGPQQPATGKENLDAIRDSLEKG